MINVSGIDRLVVSDDAIAARLWPRLGPRVRGAYLADRDKWVGLRRQVEAGATLPRSTLVAEHKVFSGWARAFHAATTNHPKGHPASPTVRRTTPLAAPNTVAVAAPTVDRPFVETTPPSMPSALASVTKAKGHTVPAVAGGLLLAGLIAVAAKRKRP